MSTPGSNSWSLRCIPNTNNKKRKGEYADKQVSLEKKSPSSAIGWGSSVPDSGHQETKTTSCLKFRQPHITLKRKIRSAYAVKSNGFLEVIRENHDEFYLRWRFGDRVKVIEVSASKICSPLEKTKVIGGNKCVLVATKFEKSSNSTVPNNFMCGKLVGPHIKAFYLKGNKANYGPRDAQKELDSIAKFSDLALKPGKLANRLELLVSPAAWEVGNKNPYMFSLPLSFFEEISTPENKTMGCGFIPPNMLVKLLGYGSLGS